jgi:hypothetical protein
MGIKAGHIYPKNYAEYGIGAAPTANTVILSVEIYSGD